MRAAEERSSIVVVVPRRVVVVPRKKSVLKEDGTVKHRCTLLCTYGDDARQIYKVHGDEKKKRVQKLVWKRRAYISLLAGSHSEQNHGRNEGRTE